MPRTRPDKVLTTSGSSWRFACTSVGLHTTASSNATLNIIVHSFRRWAQKRGHVQEASINNCAVAATLFIGRKTGKQTDDPTTLTDGKCCSWSMWLAVATHCSRGNGPNFVTVLERPGWSSTLWADTGWTSLPLPLATDPTDLRLWPFLFDFWLAYLTSAIARYFSWHYFPGRSQSVDKNSRQQQEQSEMIKKKAEKLLNTTVASQRQLVQLSRDNRRPRTKLSIASLLQLVWYPLWVGCM